MKSFSRCQCVLVAICLSFIISRALYAEVRVVNPQQRRGPDAAEKVHKLIAANSHLRAALDRIKGRGLHPHVESAVMLTGTGVRSTTSAAGIAARMQSAPRANEVVSGDAVELIFIPAYTAPGYWEGTIDAYRYDASGNLLNENIANVVISSPDPSTAFDVTYADPVYEFNVTNDGPYSLNAPGGDQYPTETQTQKPRPRLAPALQPRLKPVTMQTWRGCWSCWGKCSLAWCGGAAVACAVANWWNAELAWGPCTTIGCIGGTIGCTYGTLWN